MENCSLGRIEYEGDNVFSAYNKILKEYKLPFYITCYNGGKKTYQSWRRIGKSCSTDNLNVRYVSEKEVNEWFKNHFGVQANTFLKNPSQYEDKLKLIEVSKVHKVHKVHKVEEKKEEKTKEPEKETPKPKSVRPHYKFIGKGICEDKRVELYLTGTGNSTVYYFYDRAKKDFMIIPKELSERFKYRAEKLMVIDARLPKAKEPEKMQNAELKMQNVKKAEPEKEPELTAAEKSALEAQEAMKAFINKWK